jgi:hypothetical protein
VHPSPHEQALLAYRWLNVGDDRMWLHFPRYWMAFNALYKVVQRPGQREDQAVGGVIELFFEKDAAQRCLDLVKGPIDDLVRLPPGDDRRGPHDPDYRGKTTALANVIGSSTDPIERLSCVMKVVYQVRCNLLHGSKDPAVMRDQELIAYCTPILEVVVPTLQAIMESHHSVPRPAAGC